MSGSADRAVEHAVLRGWKVLVLRSDELELRVVPALGGAVTGLTRRSDGLALTWASPWGLPGPGTGMLGGSAEELRADADTGGWQTLFPNAGDNAVVDGIEWGVDGEARVTPFDVGEIDDRGDSARVQLTGRLRRSPFTVTKTFDVTAGRVSLTERVEHHGQDRTNVIWGARVCLGAPLLAPGALIDSGASLVHPDGSLQFDAEYDDVFPWPRSPGPQSMINLRYLPEPDRRENRTAYLTGFGDGWATVANPELDVRLRLGWDTTVWPHLWYQLEDGGTREHPWFGAERFLALTPCSGWPARGVHDARRISGDTLAFDPGEIRTAELTLSLETAGH